MERWEDWGDWNGVEGAGCRLGVLRVVEARFGGGGGE